MLENDTHRVQKLDPTGGFLAKWGGVGSAAGDLYFPEDIAVDAAAGAVYVVDSGNYRIEKFDTSGGVRLRLGQGRGRRQPGVPGLHNAVPGRYVQPDGGCVQVPDRDRDGRGERLRGGPEQRQRPQVRPCRRSRRSVTIPGSQKPQKIAVSAGMVYVTTRADTVWRFDTNGVPDTGWDGDGVTGSSGGGPGQLRTIPQGIAVDATGAYVTDSGDQRIVKFDLNGGFAAAWGSEGSADGQFMWPYGVTAARGLRAGGGHLQPPASKFDQAGAYKRSVGAPLGLGDLYWPSDVAPAPSGGGVYVANWSAKDIQRLDESGAAIGRWSTAPSLPAGISPHGQWAVRARRHKPREPLRLWRQPPEQVRKPRFRSRRVQLPLRQRDRRTGEPVRRRPPEQPCPEARPDGSPLAVFGWVGSGRRPAPRSRWTWRSITPGFSSWRTQATIGSRSSAPRATSSPSGEAPGSGGGQFATIGGADDRLRGSPLRVR